MDVQIVDFPETKVAVLEHHGSPHLEPETVRKLIEWRLANRLALIAIAVTVSITMIHAPPRPRTIE